MSLGSDFISGFSAVRDVKEKRKRRELESENAAAERALKLDLQMRDAAARKALQDEQLVHDAKRQFNDQSWRSGEAGADRGWRTGERQGAQGFSGKQAEIDRALKKQLQEQQLTAAAKQFGQKMDFDTLSFEENTALKKRQQNWQEDPRNPFNQLRDAQSLNERLDAEMAGGESSNDKSKSSGATGPGGLRPGQIVTQGGKRYLWNGQAMIPVE